MDKQQTTPVINSKLRAVGGELDGQWLRTVDVANKSGIPFRDGPNWDDVERHPDKYTPLHPKFIFEERSAYRATTEQAERLKRMLKKQGIEIEIVAI